MYFDIKCLIKEALNHHIPHARLGCYPAHRAALQRLCGSLVESRTAVAPSADHVLALKHNRRQTRLETERTRLVCREVGKRKRAPVHHAARVVADAAVQVEYPLRLQFAAQHEVRARLLDLLAPLLGVCDFGPSVFARELQHEVAERGRKLGSVQALPPATGCACVRGSLHFLNATCTRQKKHTNTRIETLLPLADILLEEFLVYFELIHLFLQILLTARVVLADSLGAAQEFLAENLLV